MFYEKKVSLKISQNSQENTFARPATLLQEGLAQLFSCEFYEIFENIIFTEHLWTTAFVVL